MFAIIICYVLSTTISFANLGFKSEYKNNRTFYDEMIVESFNSEDTNNNVLIKVKIVDYLNIIVNKNLNGPYKSDEYMLKKVVQIKGAGAKNTAIKIEEDKLKKIIAICDNSKW